MNIFSFFWEDFNESWPDWLIDATPIIAIFLAVISNLASVGYQVKEYLDKFCSHMSSNNDAKYMVKCVQNTIIVIR